MQRRRRIELSLLTPGARVPSLRHVPHLVPVSHSGHEIVQQDEVDDQVAHDVRRGCPAAGFPAVVVVVGGGGVDRPVAEDIAGHAGSDVNGSGVAVQVGGPGDVGADSVLDEGSEGDRTPSEVGRRGVGWISSLSLSAERRLAIVPPVVVAVSALRLALFARSTRTTRVVRVAPSDSVVRRVTVRVQQVYNRSINHSISQSLIGTLTATTLD